MPDLARETVGHGFGAVIGKARGHIDGLGRFALFAAPCAAAHGRVALRQLRVILRSCPVSLSWGLALEPARRKSKGIQRKAGCARMNSD
jgi:hypothetical protein